MPFEADDVFPGMIGYFTVNKLRRDGRIRSTNATRDTKPRPFVCYAEVDGVSYWTAFTTTPKRNRDRIDRRWLRNFTRSDLGKQTLIISDARNGFAGPNEAFADLSNRYDTFHGVRRPLLLPQGVDEVIGCVRRKGGLLPRALRCTATPRTPACHEPQRLAA